VTPGPVFFASGPDAELYGANAGFPIADVKQRRWPDQAPYRVGSYSHYDEVYPVRRIRAAANPWRFRYSDQEVAYWFWGEPSSLVDYLTRTPTTGLLVARDDEILFEGYQYGRTDRDRLVSMSMSKTINSMLIGIAINEGRIRSVTDHVAEYVPELGDVEYGRTSILDLLHMSSGIEFREHEDNNRDLHRLWMDMVIGSEKGTINSIAQFNTRIAAPGTRFFYASIEADVLGLVLRSAVGKSISEYLYEKIWEPIGAEADAAWLVDSHGIEVAHAFFNAALRDYARLGRLLANDGQWEGRQLIPRQWVVDATTVRPSDGYLAPGKATPMQGYGYQVWILPGNRRTFALNGFRGQHICVDPDSKLVLVQTAVDWHNEFWWLWSSLVKQFRSR
jgi:CubicO group peptidase (beta-lactamase class C family)